MGRKRTPGLYKREGIWHIDKKFNGRRLCESTGTGDLEDAEKYLARRLETLRQAVVYGVRPQRIFREAATKYLLENQHKASIVDDAMHLKQLDPCIGELYLEQVHSGSLQPFVEMKKKQGRKNKSVNLALGVVRRILNLAASEWLDEHGFTWLKTAPKIKLLPISDARKPYPLAREEQEKVFSYLPEHLQKMALFKVNTGCREQEVCQLRWEWEVPVPELNASVFLIPGHIVKNREDRLVVVNSIAKSVIEEVRGMHPEYVFTYQGRHVTKMNNSAWKRARKLAGIDVRVHDLKHTFGRRLRSAGVSFEDRQDLLGHRSGRITTHYSAAELTNLIRAANTVCEKKDSATVTVLRVLRNVAPAKVPQGGEAGLRKVM